jgi:hypothetical protein
MSSQQSRKDGRVPTPRILRADQKRKVTLHLSVGADSLLSTMAKMRGNNRSSEMERLILKGGSGVAITHNGKDYAAGTLSADEQG